MNKDQVIDKNLHEIKNEKLLDYTGELKMVRILKVDDQIRFRNIDDYETYINAIDEGYDAEGAIFKGYVYKINSPQFNKINKGQYGNGCDFKHEVIEYPGKYCFIPTKGYCFVK